MQQFAIPTGGPAIAPEGRVVIAPDSFKGTLTAEQAAEALARGWHNVCPNAELVLLPMADGGEGTMEALAGHLPGTWHRVQTCGPLASMQRESSWYRTDDNGGDQVAICELAASSGIGLLPELAPLDATTRGFGQVLRAVREARAARVLAGIGGSASTDGGLGMLTALGARCLDARGEPIVDGARGLAALHRIDLSGLVPLPDGGVQVLTDVTNPLTGPTGAARVFGPQKGLVEGQIDQVDATLGRVAELLDVDPATPGAGAAGGTAAALLAWGAELVPGAVRVAEMTGLDKALEAADLVITGEGRHDAQSASGKVVGQVLHLANTCARRPGGVPVAIVAGSFEQPPSEPATLALVDMVGRDRAMADPSGALELAGRQLAQQLTTGHR